MKRPSLRDPRVVAAEAYMRGWIDGANGKPGRSPKRDADAYERGYYAGQTARDQAQRMARGGVS